MLEGIRAAAASAFETAKVKANDVKERVAEVLTPSDEKIDNYIKNNAGMLFAGAMLMSAALTSPVLCAAVFTAGLLAGNNADPAFGETAKNISEWIGGRHGIFRAMAYTALFIAVRSNALIFGLGMATQGFLTGFALKNLSADHLGQDGWQAFN